MSDQDRFEHEVMREQFEKDFNKYVAEMEKDYGHRKGGNLSGTKRAVQPEGYPLEGGRDQQEEDS